MPRPSAASSSSSRSSEPTRNVRIFLTGSPHPRPATHPPPQRPMPCRSPVAPRMLRTDVHRPVEIRVAEIPKRTRSDQPAATRAHDLAQLDPTPPHLAETTMPSTETRATVPPGFIVQQITAERPVIQRNPDKRRFGSAIPPKGREMTIARESRSRRGCPPPAEGLHDRLFQPSRRPHAVKESGVY
jgi:hypothetical protein